MEEVIKYSLYMVDEGSIDSKSYFTDSNRVILDRIMKKKVKIDILRDENYINKIGAQKELINDLGDSTLFLNKYEQDTVPMINCEMRDKYCIRYLSMKKIRKLPNKHTGHIKNGTCMIEFMGTLISESGIGIVSAFINTEQMLMNSIYYIFEFKKNISNKWELV